MKKYKNTENAAMNNGENIVSLAKPVRKGIMSLIFSRFFLFAILLVLQVALAVMAYLQFREKLPVLLMMDWKALDEETGNKLISIMEDIGIADSDSYASDAEGQEYIKSLGEVTEEMIYEEILRYVSNNPDNKLEDILEVFHNK